MYMVLGIVIPINYVALMKVMQITHLNNTSIGIILLYVVSAASVYGLSHLWFCGQGACRAG